MTDIEEFIKPFFARNYRFWSGVPCSFLKPLINYTLTSPEATYVAASSEGEAVAIAMGAHLTGQKTVVLCQNSGLGNTVNPLTSLSFPFRIPTLLIVSHRGAPGLNDEPQHTLMGKITEELLSTMRIPFKIFPDDSSDVNALLNEADNYIRSESRPFAFIMKKDSLTSHDLGDSPAKKSPAPVPPVGLFTKKLSERLIRLEAIKIIRGSLSGDELILGTTGKTGRELFSLGHKPNQLYIIGGMGCVSAIGLGIGLSQSKQKVVILDGDGSMLMKMGTLATIGHYAPENLIHIVLDNESHESTGGQETVSPSVDFALNASACSYSHSFRIDSETELKDTLRKSLKTSGPIFIHLKIKPGSDPKLGRPNLTPEEVKQQFMEYIQK